MALLYYSLILTSLLFESPVQCAELAPNPSKEITRNIDYNNIFKEMSNFDPNGGADKNRLYDYLMTGYDRNRVPMDPLTGNGTNVTIYMWPYDILEVDEARSSIKISGWIDMRWTEPRFRWDPSDFGGVIDVFMPSSFVWEPMVDLFYSKSDKSGTIKCVECPVRVDYNGTILRGYYFAYQFPCSFDVKYFPFDYQFCHMALANWHMDKRMMDLWPQTEEVDLSIFLVNEEWDVMSMNVTRTEDFYNYGTFSILNYTISLRRKPFYYVVNLVTPTLILTVTALIGYHMPSTGTGVHQEKVKMGLTTILSIYILQLGVSDTLPRTSDVVPLIFVYYSALVGLLSSAIVTTSLVIVIEKQGIYGKPVPNWLVRMFPRLTLMSAMHQILYSLAYSRNDVIVSKIPVSEDENGSHCKMQISGTPLSPVVNDHRHCRMLDCGCRLRRKPSFTSATRDRTRDESGGYQLIQQTIGDMTPDMRGSKAALNGSCVQCSNQSSLIDSKSTGFNTQQVLHEILYEVQKSLNTAQTELFAKKKQIKIRSQWIKLADIIENISLAVYLFAAFTALLGFAYHSWY